MPLGFGVLIRAFLVRRKYVRNISSMLIGVASLRCRLWLLQAATHQNLIRSPCINIQNGGLAVVAEGFSKLSFNVNHFSSVPVHVGSSGDQSVLPVVLRSVSKRRGQSNATQSSFCAAITS